MAVSNSQRVIGGAEIGRTASRRAVQQQKRTLDCRVGFASYGGADGHPSAFVRLDGCPALLLHPTETVRRRLLATASLMIYLTTASPATYRDSQLDPGTLLISAYPPAILISLYSHILFPLLHFYNYLSRGPCSSTSAAAHSITHPNHTHHIP